MKYCKDFFSILLFCLDGCQFLNHQSFIIPEPFHNQVSAYKIVFVRTPYSNLVNIVDFVNRQNNP